MHQNGVLKTLIIYYCYYYLFIIINYIFNPLTFHFLHFFDFCKDFSWFVCNYLVHGYCLFFSCLSCFQGVFVYVLTITIINFMSLVVLIIYTFLISLLLFKYFAIFFNKTASINYGNSLTFVITLETKFVKQC